MSEHPAGFPELIDALVRGQDLTRAQAAWAMTQLMSGEASPVTIAGFLVALRAKGETVDELAALVDVMLGNAVKIDVPGPCVDVVGTGGDGSHSVNISTMAALVVAGTGLRVVKHGNRAASSSSGAADVLEALGIRLDLAPEKVAELARSVGITFCFAQVFHPSMRHAGPVRRELGVRTSFNFLGPLTNPANAGAAAIGCSDERMAPLMAGVLAERGTQALVMRGADGLDEFSTSSPTTVWWVDSGKVTVEEVDAVALGLPRVDQVVLRGGDPSHNAGVVRDLVAGTPGPVRDAVALNAAAALVAAGHGEGSLTDRLASALPVALTSIDSGAAARVLREWVEASNS